MNSDVLITGIKRAVKYLREKKKFLDNINVFPVEDNDTGDNLFETLNQAIKEIKDTSPHFLKKFAEKTFFTARGNSGLIISQFFSGFLGELDGKNKIDPEIFVKAFETGRKRAYDAVSKPLEGTILTAIKETEKALKKSLSKGDGFVDTLKFSLKNGEEAVLRTKEMLQELREKNVPDAGAYGFYYIFKGIVECYETYGDRGDNRKGKS